MTWQILQNMPVWWWATWVLPVGCFIIAALIFVKAAANARGGRR